MGTKNLSSDELQEIVDNQQQIIERKTEAFFGLRTNPAAYLFSCSLSIVCSV